MRVSVALALCCLCTLSFAADPAHASIRKTTDIPAEELGSALQTLAKDYDFQVLYRTEIVKDLRTQGAVGTLTSDEALGKVLKGTGLSYKYLDANTVTVYPASTGSTSSNSQPASAGSAGDADTTGGGKKSSQDFRVAQVDQGKASSDVSVARQADQNAGGLAEIIVTAEKRSENLQNVPASIIALSGESLQRQGVVDFADYMALVPSLSHFDQAGGEGHGTIILRGLNTGFYQFSNTVGYYLDDTPFSATSSLSNGAYLTLDPDLNDIDHLEVLEGPQGTLYGASTLGGLIKVVMKKPDLNSFSGEAQVSGSTVDGGASGYGLTGVANLPLIPGQLALRLSGFDRDIPGYMTNVTLGTTDRSVSHKDGGRLSLLWAPSDNLSIEVSAFLQSVVTDGSNYEFVDLKTLQPLTGLNTYSLRYDPTYQTSYEVYNAALDYKVGSIGTLTSSSSYARYSDHELVDFSQYYGPYYNSFAPEPVPSNAALIIPFSPSLDKFSEELRFTSQRIGAFEWIAGLFYTNEQIGYTSYTLNVIPPSLQPIPGPSGNAVSYTSPATYKEEAGFANLTYYFADAVDLTLGGRYSHNRQETTYCQTGFAAPFVGCVANGSSDSDLTYLFALRWRPTEGLNTYARIASSYRPGGPQLTPIPGFPNSFKPDSLVNYEVGLKGDWLEHKLRTNVSVYDMEWKDVQMSSNINGFVLISNAAKARVRGVEFEAQAVPVERLTLALTFAYTDAKLKSVDESVTEITGAVAGDSLPFTPRWAASVVADYTQPITGELNANVGATYSYQGSRWSDYPGDFSNTGVVIPHYDTVNVRAGLGWGRYLLQARVSNLFNSRGITSVVDYRIEDDPPAWAAITPPRTFTLSAAIKF